MSNELILLDARCGNQDVWQLHSSLLRRPGPASGRASRGPGWIYRKLVVSCGRPLAHLMCQPPQRSPHAPSDRRRWRPAWYTVMFAPLPRRAQYDPAPADRRRRSVRATRRGTEVVVTGAPRKRLVRKGTWVRIPPSPPHHFSGNPPDFADLSETANLCLRGVGTADLLGNGSDWGGPRGFHSRVSFHAGDRAARTR